MLRSIGLQSGTTNASVVNIPFRNHKIDVIENDMPATEWSWKILAQVADLDHCRSVNHVLFPMV